MAGEIGGRAEGHVRAVLGRGRGEAGPGCRVSAVRGMAEAGLDGRGGSCRCTGARGSWRVCGGTWRMRRCGLEGEGGRLGGRVAGGLVATCHVDARWPVNTCWSLDARRSLFGRPMGRGHATRLLARLLRAGHCSVCGVLLRCGLLRGNGERPQGREEGLGRAAVAEDWLRRRERRAVVRMVLSSTRKKGVGQAHSRGVVRQADTVGQAAPVAVRMAAGPQPPSPDSGRRPPETPAPTPRQHRHSRSPARPPPSSAHSVRSAPSGPGLGPCAGAYDPYSRPCLPRPLHPPPPRHAPSPPRWWKPRPPPQCHHSPQPRHSHPLCSPGHSPLAFAALLPHPPPAAHPHRQPPAPSLLPSARLPDVSQQLWAHRLSPPPQSLFSFRRPPPSSTPPVLPPPSQPSHLHP